MKTGFGCDPSPGGEQQRPGPVQRPDSVEHTALAEQVLARKAGPLEAVCVPGLPEQSSHLLDHSLRNVLSVQVGLLGRPVVAAPLVPDARLAIGCHRLAARPDPLAQLAAGAHEVEPDGNLHQQPAALDPPLLHAHRERRGRQLPDPVTQKSRVADSTSPGRLPPRIAASAASTSRRAEVLIGILLSR